MSKAFGLIVMMIGLYVGMTIYTEGIDSAFGGILASQSEDEAPTPGSITESVRDRVAQDMEAGAARRGYTD
jgi:hypothetical protein